METINVAINQYGTSCVPSGQTIYEVLRQHLPPGSYQPFAAVRNNVFTSMNETLHFDTQISALPHFYETSRRAYEQAAILMLDYVVEQLFPGNALIVMHSICDGVYCRLRQDRVDPEAIDRIRQAFHRLVKENHAIRPVLMNRLDAIRYFEQKGRKDTAELLRYCHFSHLDLYTLDGQLYWAPFAPAPFTELIKTIDFVPYADGFIMRCPTEGNPEQLLPFNDQPRLYDVFQESDRWGAILAISEVADLNRLIVASEISDVIKISEALHEKKIAQIADQIASNPARRLVFVAGPSSSGKTTFAKRLAIQLRVLGYHVKPISLDDYFLDREELRRRQGENLNFEVLEALDLDLLNTQLAQLLQGKAVNIPEYDFHTGMKRPRKESFQPTPDTIYILEGIHGINPDLTPGIADEFKYKIYISALTHLNYDRLNRIATHDMRLIRRIVRDARYRGYSAANTIGMWKKVVEGEKRYIFSFQGTADVMFNSALLYEINVLKIYAEPVLKKVPENDRSYPEAQRLLGILSYFLTIDDDEVPPTSIMREFIGKSSFTY